MSRQNGDMKWARRTVGLLATTVLVTGAVAAPAEAGMSPSEAHRVSPRSFAPRSAPAVVWFDGRLFLFGGFSAGGDTLRRDGALIDPASGRAQRLPNLRTAPLLLPAAAATGDRVVVAGSSCAETDYDDDLGSLNCADGRYAAADWKPSSGRWRSIDLPDELRVRQRSDDNEFRRVQALGTLTDGSAVFATVTAVSADGGYEYRTKFWTYAPETRTWAAVAAPPGSVMASCLAGDRIVAFSGTPAAPSLAVFDTTQATEWRVTPPDPTITVSGDTYLSCARDHVVVTGLRADAPTLPADILSVAVATVDDGAWIKGTAPGYPQPIPDPRRAIGLLSTAVWTGTELVFPSAAYAYDPTTGTWRELSNVAPGDGPISVRAGDAVAGYFVDRTAEQLEAFVYSHSVG